MTRMCRLNLFLSLVGVITQKLLKFPSDLKAITDDVCRIVVRYNQFDFKLIG